MANNIGTIGSALSRTIGDSTTITDATVIHALSGFIDVGFMGFDNDGTLGVCTSFTRDDQDKPIYVFRTCSLDTNIDIKTILSKDY